MRTAAATDTGYLRASNQDVALATSDLAAVADGMGGHLGGEVAARIAVEHLLDAYRRDRTTDGLIAAVVAANSAVYSRSKSDRNLRGMGTTLTAAAFMGDKPDGTTCPRERRRLEGISPRPS
jgi:serine/threonine protein phosphatase PrpC